MLIALGASCWGLSAQNEKGYDPDVFALESGRGQLAKEYFGVKLSDVAKDSKGRYQFTEAQRDTIKANILGDHLCSLQWISWKKFGKEPSPRNRMAEFIAQAVRATRRVII